jgi:hypothetical protein
MGGAWGWHGVSTGPHGVGMGLAWGWHGVGMGSTSCQLIAYCNSIDYPIGNLLIEGVFIFFFYTL